jgi:hypothetical protein
MRKANVNYDVEKYKSTHLLTNYIIASITYDE